MPEKTVHARVRALTLCMQHTGLMLSTHGQFSKYPSGDGGQRDVA